MGDGRDREPNQASHPQREPLVPAELGRVRFDAGKAMWLWGMAVPGVIALGLCGLLLRSAVRALDCSWGFLRFDICAFDSGPGWPK